MGNVRSIRSTLVLYTQVLFIPVGCAFLLGMAVGFALAWL